MKYKMSEFRYDEGKFLLHLEKEYETKELVKELVTISERLTASAGSDTLSEYSRFKGDVENVYQYCVRMTECMEECKTSMKDATKKIRDLLEESEYFVKATLPSV